MPEQRNTSPASSNPVARALPAAEVAAFLRSLVGLPPSDRESPEVAGRPAPVAIDATAWIGWTLAGLYACALPSTDVDDEDEGVSRRRGPWVPPIRIMMREARRVAVVVAMHRHDGNLTHAAEALGTSRRALRDTLKHAGLYPWGGVAEDDDEGADGTTTDDAASTDTRADHTMVDAAAIATNDVSATPADSPVRIDTSDTTDATSSDDVANGGE